MVLPVAAPVVSGIVSAVSSLFGGKKKKQKLPPGTYAKPLSSQHDAAAVHLLITDIQQAGAKVQQYAKALAPYANDPVAQEAFQTLARDLQELEKAAELSQKNFVVPDFASPEDYYEEPSLAWDSISETLSLVEQDLEGLGYSLHTVQQNVVSAQEEQARKIKEAQAAALEAQQFEEMKRQSAFLEQQEEAEFQTQRAKQAQRYDWLAKQQANQQAAFTSMYRQILGIKGLKDEEFHLDIMTPESGYVPDYLDFPWYQANPVPGPLTSVDPFTGAPVQQPIEPLGSELFPGGSPFGAPSSQVPSFDPTNDPFFASLFQPFQPFGVQQQQGKQVQQQQGQWAGQQQQGQQQQLWSAPQQESPWKTSQLPMTSGSGGAIGSTPGPSYDPRAFNTPSDMDIDNAAAPELWGYLGQMGSAQGDDALAGAGAGFFASLIQWLTPREQAPAMPWTASPGRPSGGYQMTPGESQYQQMVGTPGGWADAAPDSVDVANDVVGEAPSFPGLSGYRERF